MCIARSGGAGERRRRPACTIDWSWHILPPRPPPPFHGKVVHRGRPSLAFCCSSISAIIGFLAPLSPPWTGSLSIAYETNIDLSTCILDSSIDKTKRGGKIKSRREREERKDAYLGRKLGRPVVIICGSKSWKKQRDLIHKRSKYSRGMEEKVAFVRLRGTSTCAGETPTRLKAGKPRYSSRSVMPDGDESIAGRRATE